MRTRSPPARPPDVVSSAASGRSSAGAFGNSTRQGARWKRWLRAVRPSSRLKRISEAPSQRSNAGEAWAVAGTVRCRSDRKVTTDIRLHHVPGEARQYHLAAVHDHIGVGERARELEVLLDQQDRHVAARGEVAND